VVKWERFGAEDVTVFEFKNDESGLPDLFDDKANRDTYKGKASC
jgi:hypothetical protein